MKLTEELIATGLKQAEYRRRQYLEKYGLLPDSTKETDEERQIRIAQNWKMTLRPAFKREYAKWLNHYLENGGEITHFYDYNFPANMFFVATCDIVVTPLYGANAFSVIVPYGITVTGETGHSNIYRYDNSGVLRFVPAYKNLLT